MHGCREWIWGGHAVLQCSNSGTDGQGHRGQRVESITLCLPAAEPAPEGAAVAESLTASAPPPTADEYTPTHTHTQTPAQREREKKKKRKR